MANIPKGAKPKTPTGRVQRKTAGKKASNTSRSKKATTKQSAAKPQNETGWEDEFEGLPDFESLEDGPEMDPEFEAYMKAAAQRYIAHRQAGGGSQQSKSRTQSGAPDSQSGMNSSAMGGGQMPGGEDYLNMLTRILEDMGGGELYPGQFDDMAGGVNMILGSGPAFATLNTMMTNSSAQGSVLLNATQMQRQLDQVGLVCTSACVKQLLNLNQSTGDGE